MIGKVAGHADAALPDRPAFAEGAEGPSDVTDVVAQATVEMARALSAAAILCATTSGSTPRLVAKYRPDTLIIAATPNPETCRRLALTWGVRPILIDPVNGTDEM